MSILEWLNSAWWCGCGHGFSRNDELSATEVSPPKLLIILLLSVCTLHHLFIPMIYWSLAFGVSIVIQCPLS